MSRWWETTTSEEPEDGDAHPPRTCGKGHRSSLLLSTPSGGAICLVCFSNLLSSPSPSHHVSYALSQLSLASSSSTSFLHSLRSLHSPLLLPPLLRSLSSPLPSLAPHLLHLLSLLCGDPRDPSSLPLSRDLASRIARLLLSDALAPRHLHLLHCFGTLLDRPDIDEVTSCARDMVALVMNLVTGLEFPSEEFRGEILFVLYKLSLIQDMPWDCGDGEDGYDIVPVRAKLLKLCLETLLKAQSDDVRLNCIALLTVLARKGLLITSLNNYSNSPSQELHDSEDNGSIFTPPSVNLFSDAIKGPLLSSDIQVQIGALDLIFHSFQSDTSQIKVLNEECVTDYVFEILRLSENNDALIISGLKVLDILAIAEETFKPRLVIGFPVLLSSLRYVAEIPLHPVQPQALRLVSMCIMSFPDVMSLSQLEDLAVILANIFGRHNCGDLGMLPETFVLACLTFVEVLNSPNSSHVLKIAILAQQASRDAVFSILPRHNDTCSFLHSLYLLKEAYRYVHDETFTMNKNSDSLEICILEICEAHLLPWLKCILDQGVEEDAVLGVLETFSFILIQGSDLQSRNFAKTLCSSLWLSLSFGFLGLFPSDRMKSRVYLMLSSVVDNILGEDCGHPIRESCMNLPMDPLELIFLLGQKSSLDAGLFSAQSAVILIFYVSSLLDERLADENQILASLEQYILVNGNDFACGIANPVLLTQLIHLYGFMRGSRLTGCCTSYSSESEKLLFRLMVENEWDLLSMGIHPISLKWLFQQEKILSTLSTQILSFCRCYRTQENQLVVQGHGIHTVDISKITELAASEDNFLTFVLVYLLENCHAKGQDDDMISVMNVIEEILRISPDASNQFCTNRIDVVIFNFYHSRLSNELDTRCKVLVLNLLCLVQAANLHNGDSWLSITVKLLEDLGSSLNGEACSGQEASLVLGILTLILRHGASRVLLEASRSILLNPSLIGAMDIKIRESCAKGPALAEHGDTRAGELLLLMLILYYYALRSVDPETFNWLDLLESRKGAHKSLVFCIHCQDLCRLIHFGFPSVKLAASQCLVELLTRISCQKNKVHDELKISAKCIRSMIAVIESLIFYEDHRVATNCALCLSTILGWENLGSLEKRAMTNSKWCRLIMEELALSLAAPGLASKAFANQHKPATLVAIALLRIDHISCGLSLAFDSSCISCIISKLSAKNLSREIVEFFRELLVKKYLNKEHVSALLHIFQACRKYMYGKMSIEDHSEDYTEKVSAVSDETESCRLLMNLLLTSNLDCRSSKTEQNRLLEEIEMFISDSDGLH